LKPRAGYSVLEVALSCALLLLATVGAFSIFRFGFSSFQTLTNRADLHAEAQACLVRLREDVESASHSGSQVGNGPTRVANVALATGNTVQPRHLLCVPGMMDWYDPGVYSPLNGWPVWNRHYLYHASTAAEGSLTRLELDSGAHTGQGWGMFSSYLGTYLASPPGRGTNIGGTVVRSRRALTTRLLAFEVTKSSKNIVLELKLRGQVRSAAGGGRRDEILEFKIRLLPKNRSY